MTEVSFRMLSDVYNEERLSSARVFKCHKRFCNGIDDAEESAIE